MHLPITMSIPFFFLKIDLSHLLDQKELQRSQTSSFGIKDERGKEICEFWGNPPLQASFFRGKEWK